MFDVVINLDIFQLQMLVYFDFVDFSLKKKIKKSFNMIDFFYFLKFFLDYYLDLQSDWFINEQHKTTIQKKTHIVIY